MIFMVNIKKIGGNRSGLGSRPAVIWPADQDQIGPVTISGQAKDSAVSVRVSALGCPDPMHGGGAADAI